MKSCEFSPALARPLLIAGFQHHIDFVDPMLKDIMGDIAPCQHVEFFGRPRHILGPNLRQKPGERADKQRLEP